MLKSRMPVFLCSTAFSVATFSAGDQHTAAAAASLADASARYEASRGATASRKSHSGVIVATPGRQTMRFVRHYISDNSDVLTVVRDRSEVPFSIIDSVFNYYDLPRELKYLAVIESELKASAVSRVGAKGPWQLMPGTARDLGLKVNGRIDERMNYYKSTRAAALYLRDLHRQFGDWLLVLAAYNGGPAPVLRAIGQAHSRSFWALQYYLPSESREHVKKFIATDYYFERVAAKEKPLQTERHAVATSLPRAEQATLHHESADERFTRLMNVSATSLQKSSELLAGNIR